MTFNILITPIAAVAATYKRPEFNKQELGAGSQESGAKSAVADVFAKPVEELAKTTAPEAVPVPAPLPMPAAPPAGSVTSTLIGSVETVDGGVDVDGDHKVDPGVDTIGYTLSLTNASGAGATGLAIANPLDSHTALVAGTLNSTPVAFDQTLITDEDINGGAGVGIILQGQDPDGTVASSVPAFTFRTSAGAALPASIATAHGTVGSFGSVTCDVNGVCSLPATYKPAANYNGPDTFTFKVNDGTANSNEVGTVSITVNSVNDAPTFTVPGNPTAVSEDAGVQTVSNYITGIRPAQGPPSINSTEDTQVVDFVISNVTHSALFTAGGQPTLTISNGGNPPYGAGGLNATLTYTPAPNANGTAVVTYHLHDNGGTANGGVNVSAGPDPTFTIQVNALNDAPVAAAAGFSLQANMKRTTLSLPLTIAGGVSDPDVTNANADASSNDATFFGSTAPNFSLLAGSIVPGGATPCAATGNVSNPTTTVASGINQSVAFDYDPPPGFTGTCTLVYKITDNGNPGTATSANATITMTISGPVIWFVKPGAAFNGNGTLSNTGVSAGQAGPFNSLASASTKINLNTNQKVFVYSGTTPAGEALDLSGNGNWLVGQGTVTVLQTTTLNGAINNVTTSVTVANATNIQANQYIQIDSEWMQVVSKAGNVLTVTRPVNGTSAASHLNGANVSAGGSFDAFFGLSPPAGTIGRPTLNSNATSANTARPTISGTVTMRNVTQVTGVNIVTTGGSTGLSGIFSAAGTSLIKDVNVTTASGSAVDLSGTQTVTYETSDNANSPNLITSSTGGAVLVSSSTIGANGFNFKSVSTGAGGSAPARGIFLNGTGAGPFTITGDGSTANSGGTIQHTGGTPGTQVQGGTGAIDIEGGSGTYSFNFMKVFAPGGDGFFVYNSPSTISIVKSTIDHNSAVIGNAYGLRYQNSSGTGTLTLDGVLVQNKGDGTTAVGVSSWGTSTINFNIQDSNTGDAFDSKYTNLFGSGVVVGAGDDAGSTSKIVFNCSNTKFVTAPSNGVNDLEMTSQQNATLVPNVNNNLFDKVGLPLFSAGVINVNTQQSGRLGDASNNALITDNIITNIQSGAGPTFAYQAGGTNGYLGIRLGIDGNAGVTDKIKILNNTIHTLARQGILVSARGSRSDVNVLISGNSVGTAADPVATSNRRGIELEIQTAAVMKVQVLNNTSIASAGTSNSNSSLSMRSGANGAGDTGTLSATVSGNTLISNSNAANTGGRFRAETLSATSATLCLDLTNTALDSAAKEFNLVQNAGSGTLTFHNHGSNTGTVTNSGAVSVSSTAGTCTLPTLSMFRPEGSQQLQQFAALLNGPTGTMAESQQNAPSSSLAFLATANSLSELLTSGRAATAPASPVATVAQIEESPAALAADSQIVTATLAAEAKVGAVESSISRGASVRNSLSSFVSAITSLIEPSAHAEEIRTAEVGSQKSEVSRLSESAAHLRGVSAAISHSLGLKASNSDEELNHARANSKLKTENLKLSSAAPLPPTPVGSFPINGTGAGQGFQLPDGKSITITFKAKLNNPPNLSGPTNPKVSAQATLTGAFVNNPLLSDDTVPPNGTDPTSTTVDLFDSTTTLAAVPSAGSWNVGQAITFTATVAPNPANATAITGKVVFKDNGTAIGACNGATGVTISSGTAQCVVTFASGAHSVVAVYSGDGNYECCAAFNTSNTLSQGAVNQSGTTTGVVSNKPGGSLVTESVIFTATVASSTGFAGPPTGNVDFYDGTVTPAHLISGCTARPLNGSAQATCTTSALDNAGSPHTINAVYAGDANFLTSTGSVSQTVSKSGTSTALSTSGTPSTPTQQVTYTATVTSQTAVTGNFTGSVAFKDNGNLITCEAGSQSLTAGGSATCKVTYPDTTNSPHPITAVYGGDTTYNASPASNTVNQVVSQTATTTTLVSSPNPSTPTDPVTLTATISPSSATGTVDFKDNGNPIVAGCTGVSVSAGQAQCIVPASTFSNGTHPLTAVYSGDAVFSGSTSSPPVQQVVSSCANPYVVTKTADDGSAGTLRTGINGGVCVGGTITFDPVVFAGPAMHTIELIDANGELLVASDMTISGPGSSIVTVKRASAAATNFRVFNVTAIATISGITISNGAKVGGTGAPGFGGGIANSGTLTLSDVVVSGNQATGGVGAAHGLGGDGQGGGIFNGFILTINNSTISGNTATGGAGGDGTGGTNGSGGNGQGGGIYNTATLSLNNTSVSGTNAAVGGAVGTGGTGGVAGTGIGGGVYTEGSASDSVATIFNSTISSNTASNGGGVANVAITANALLAIIDSTISGNVASNDGGGVYNTGANATATITGSTITNNHADNDASSAGTGGGIRVVGGSVALNSTIVAANFATSLQVETVTVLGSITAGRKQENTLIVTGGPAATTGDIIVTLTAPGMPGTPKVFTISIPSGATNGDVAEAIRSSLGGDAQITGYFDILPASPPGTDPNVVLRRTTAAADDPGIVLSLNGCGNSCTGINTTQSAISVHGAAPTSGVAEAETIVVQSGPTACGATPTVLVTVAATNMSPSTITLHVPVTDGDSTDVTADDILTYITTSADADAVTVRNFFAVTKPAAGTLKFTAQTAAANDPNMRIQIGSDSCTVATPSDSFPNSGTGAAPTPGTPQENTLTVTGGPAATTGDIIITLTAPGMPGNPKSFTISISSGASNDDVATAIRSSLSGDGQITGYFNVGGTGADVVLQRTVAANDDNGIVLNLNGCGNSCTGINSTASTDSLTGIAPGTGTAKVTITADNSYFYPNPGLPGPGTKDVFANVTAGDSATQVALNLASAINSDTDVSPIFMASSNGADLILTRKVVAANDGALAMSVQNGTCTGLTPSAPSVDTKTGGSATPDDISGAIASGSFNLVGVDTGLSGITNLSNQNQIGTAVAPLDPKLDPLGNNGGPTLTHRLQTGSPALEKGTNSAVAAQLTTLNGGVNSSDLTFNVASTANISVGATILVETEQMRVTSRTATALTVAARGANGTTPAAHATGVGVFAAFDQRGFGRTVDFDTTPPVAPYDDTDIGAVELQTAPPKPNQPSLTSTNSAIPGGVLTSDGTPDFNITGVVPGALVELMRNGVSTTPATTGVAAGTSIALTDNTLPGDGTYAYTARQTVGSDTSAQSDPLNVTVDTGAPPQPVGPMLTGGSDSGTAGDNTTNVTTPTLTGTAEANSSILLFDNNVLIASTGGTDGTGTFLVTPTVALSDGLHPLTVKAKDAAGNISVVSATLNLLIDTQVAAPSTPDLDTGDDTFGAGTTGTSTDNNTSVNTPHFSGTAEANSSVTLYADGNPTPVGGPFVATGGNWTIQSSLLSDGTHSITAKTTDVAGNVSGFSSALSVVIDTASTPATPDLKDASDSFGAGTTGTNSDGLTKTTPRSFDITGTENGALVELLRNGVSLVPAVTAAGNGGTVTLTDPDVLADATYTYTAKQTDIAGNIGTSLVALSVTIDKTADTPGDPDLKDTSDAGALNNDNRTDNATHSFDISGTVAGNFVELLRDGVAVSSTQATGTSVTLQDTTSLADGVYQYTSRQMDRAGNGPTLSLGALAVTIDTTAPVVLSDTRANPNPTSASSVDFTVTFSEPVTGVDIGDFAATASGGVTLPTTPPPNPVTNVVGSGATYTVTVNTGTGDGSIRLDVIANGTIKDDMNLPFTSTFNTGQVYTVDRSNPTVTSITRAGSNPTGASSVDFLVTFSESVSGVDNGDFSLTTAGVAGASVTGVTGSGSTRTVTVNTGSGNGTIKLNLIDDDSIIDVVSKPLGGIGAGNGNFTTGETYDIDKTAPFATINQAAGQIDPVSGAAATTVINFKVTLSKPLTTAAAINSFTNSDVSVSGTAGATLGNITGSGNTYNVAVTGMTQTGTVIININAGVFQDDQGNLNGPSTIVDNTVTFNVDNFTTIEVNSTDDPGDGVCDPIGTGDGCTLREAINAANADFGAETITFNSTVFAAPGPYTINLLSALPGITSDMTITGPGAKVLSVKGKAPFRVFSISNNATVAVSDLTVTNGSTTVDGGGISVDPGTLTITRVAVTGNISTASGGGGIYSTGTLNVIESTISGNHVLPGGGGNGGGIFNNFGTLSVVNSTISGNGGGLLGGGIYSTSSATVSNSTIAGNSAQQGGGIYLSPSGIMTLKSTLIGDNTATISGPDVLGGGANGTLNSEGFNLIENTSGATITETLNPGTNITGQDAQLDPLADNGGPTMTHSLQCASPAIDKGFKFTTTTDQRGSTRPFDFADAVYPNAAGGDASDIGAYEAQGVGGCLPTAVPPSPATSTNEDTPVTITLTGTYSKNVNLTFSITQNPTIGSLGAISAPNCTFNSSISTMTCTATVQYTPNPNANGDDLPPFKFKVSAGGLDSDPVEVPVTINAINDPPTFSQAGNQTVPEDAGPQSVASFVTSFSPGPPNESGQTVQFIVTGNTNPGLFSAAPAIDGAGTLTFTSVADANGSATITMIAKDNGGGSDTSAPQSFTITVLSVNDAPTFSLGADPTVLEDAGAQTKANFATAISLGPAQEAGQTGQFIITNNTNQSMFSVAPAISPTGTLTYTAAPDANGSATITVVLKDNGGTANGGSDTSAPQTFTINVTPVNDAPTLNILPNLTVNEDGPQETIALTDISAGGGELQVLTVTAVSDNPGLIPNPTVNYVSPSGNGSISFQSVANQNGTAVITVTVNDHGGTANGGVETASRTLTVTVNAVNDPPVNAVPGPQSITENNTLTFSTANGNVISVSDIDANGNAEGVTLTATNGLITLGTTAGLSFTVGNGTANPTMTFTGTLANINTALQGMKFVPANGFSGAATLQIITNDQGNTGIGGAQTDNDTVNITVNDGGNLQLSSATYSVTENNGPAVVTITRTGGSAGTATVQIATSNGTATAGSDYTAVSQTVTFNDGETSKTVNIPITDDLANEPDETVNITLSNVGGSGALGTPATAVLTITNDDPAGGYIRFSAPAYNVAEGGVATITVQRVGTLTAAVSVEFATTDTSDPPALVPCGPTPGNTLASSRCDFNSAFGRLTWAAGDGSDKTFTVLTTQDNYVEGPETLTLTLSNPTASANFLGASTATLTINDDAVEPATNPIDDSSAFVEQNYHDFLNRPSDPSGKAFWVNNIDHCNDPAQRPPGQSAAQCIQIARVVTAGAFFLSIEFQATGGTAYLTNKASFGGLPSFSRFERDAQQIGQGYVFGAPGAEALLEANKVAYYNDYVTRPEFVNTYGGVSNQQYVDTLISNTAVPFTPAERSQLVNGLNNQTETRATVLRKIGEKDSFRTAEFSRMFVLMEYFGFLRRNPDQAGFDFWLNKLNTFNGDYFAAEMVKAFIESNEYRQRFGQ